VTWYSLFLKDKNRNKINTTIAEQAKKILIWFKFLKARNKKIVLIKKPG